MSASDRKCSRFGSEVTGIVHAERVGVFDRGANLGEQAVDRRRELGHRSRWTEAGAGDTRSPSSTASSRSLERRKRARALAVRALGGDVADQQAEGAGDQRRDDLLVELREIEQRGQRKEEGRKASGTRQDRVADLLGRACFHLA